MSTMRDAFLDNQVARHHANLMPGVVQSLARLRGRDRDASAVLSAFLRHHTGLLSRRANRAPVTEDYTLLDLDLEIDATSQAVSAPQVGSGYAGFTPPQRHQFLAWLAAPENAAPRAFQDLYVAQLEVHLLSALPMPLRAAAVLHELSSSPHWRQNEALQRANLLSCWLSQDGPGLATWLGRTTLLPHLVEVALGWQARLGAPLTPQQLGQLLAEWENDRHPPEADVLKMRLASLTTTLEHEPLQAVAAQWTDEHLTPQPWRCAHRDLRIALPQPPVRTFLEAHLRGLARVDTEPRDLPGHAATKARATDSQVNAGMMDVVILEFKQSRSEYFPYVLQQAQRLDGFAQLMDEDRRLVYRITFEKGKLRRFWRIWEYVQSWSGTRVYVNGQEMEKWKIWPYSQYMR